VEIHTENPLKNWDKLISSTPEGMIFQSSYWGDYCRSKGEIPYYIIASNESGEIQALMLAVRIWWRYEAKGFLPYLSNEILKKLPIFQWFFGPVIFYKESSELVCENIYKKILEFCREEKIYKIRNANPSIHFLPLSRQIEVEASGSFDSIIWGTYIIQLEQAEEQLWKNIKREARKSIRKGENIGIEISKINNIDELNDYTQLLKETRKKNKLAMPPYYPDTKMWQQLHSNGLLEIFVAKYQKNILAGLGILVFNKIIIEIAAARSFENVNANYAGDMLKWEIIKWGKSQNFRIYDLSGVCPSPNDEKESKIKRFKSKFEGIYVEYPLYNKNFGFLRL
jgi:lipid II:glycine glycyltransferase (peptidoglycan interpeptide bridge formation enzyme)